MDIGILIGRFPPDAIGGAELQSQQLASELAKRGHGVTVFTRGNPGHWKEHGYLVRRRHELKIPGARMLWDNVPAVWHIARCRPRPHVLLCYQTLNSGLIGALAQLTLRIPAVVYIRGNKEYRLGNSSVKKLLVPAIYRHARYVIVQSPSILDDLRSSLKSTGHATLCDELLGKTHVIPNGIRIPRGTSSSGNKVIYVGRLIRDKGIADLLAALQQLPDLETLIVGDGPDRERLEALAQGMPVTFTGGIPPSAVTDHLRQARVLVLPSHRGDGLPNVILEAMANGVPVIATRTAGIPDLINDGTTGLLFQPGDTHQLASHIGRVFREEQLWSSLKEGGLRVVSDYSWDAVTPKLERLLLDAIGTKKTAK